MIPQMKNRGIVVTNSLSILEDYATENDYEENHDHVSPVEFSQNRFETV